jgi:hypothetical protein
MSAIGKSYERTMDSITKLALDSKWGKYAMYGIMGTMVAAGALAIGLQTISTIGSNSPNPPVYRDVNGDGIKDKIIQKKVEKEGLLGTGYSALEEEVLFGVEINGKTLYLTKDQFEEYKR